jgi:hypothetical protein
MTVANAIKKLAKLGPVGHTGNQYWIKLNGMIVSFRTNGEDRPDNSITCEHTQRVGDEDDMQSDYFAGSYWPTLTAAIKYAQRF